MSLEEPLHAQSYHVLRFNSRGVGKSSGWPSFTGFSEAKDLEALVRWAIETVKDVRSLAIIVRMSFSMIIGCTQCRICPGTQGYSHGSLVASLHPTLPGIRTKHMLLSYPLGPRGWLTFFHTRTYSTQLKNLIRNPEADVLVVFGDQVRIL